jgi:hypothetical protein
MCRGGQSVTPVPAPLPDECFRCGQRMRTGYDGVMCCFNLECGELGRGVLVLDARPTGGDNA